MQWAVRQEDGEGNEALIVVGPIIEGRFNGKVRNDKKVEAEAEAALREVNLDEGELYLIEVVRTAQIVRTFRMSAPTKSEPEQTTEEVAAQVVEEVKDEQVDISFDEDSNSVIVKIGDVVWERHFASAKVASGTRMILENDIANIRRALEVHKFELSQ